MFDLLKDLWGFLNEQEVLASAHYSCPVNYRITYCDDRRFCHSSIYIRTVLSGNI